MSDPGELVFNREVSLFAGKAEFSGKLLRSYFLDLDRGKTRLGLAGKINSSASARQCLAEGYDFVSLGRAAILHHDFPDKVAADSDFAMTSLPVTEAHLRAEGLGQAFIQYMSGWDGFVQSSAKEDGS